MAKFTVNPRLQEEVAGMVRSKVDQLAQDVRRRAESLAPPLSEWRTMGDNLVRPTHRGVEGQKRPEGLRFEMKSDEWDQHHRGLGRTTYLLYPRDRSSRAWVALVNCRCRTTPAGHFKFLIDGPNVSRNRVTATVYTNDDYAIDSEFGTSYPDGNRAAPKRFMARAVAEAAAASR